MGSRLEDHCFDNLWICLSLRVIRSKTGLVGLRNSQLSKIDAAYHEMHYKVQKITHECKDMQANCFKNASIFAFIMITVFLPAMLIAKVDFKKKLSPPVIMAPITAAWIGYLVV